MDATPQLPAPEQVLERIRLCRAELAELKRLYRAATAAEKAAEARRLREAASRRMEVAHA